MRITIFLVFISAGLALTARNCFKYNCIENATNTDICMSSNKNVLFLTTCKEGFKCTLSGSELAMCKNSYYLRNLAGEYCDDNEYCSFGLQCVNNICRGKSAPELCQLDSECDAELYCFKGKCTSPTNNCSEDGTKCKSNEFCANGTCTIIAQLPNGKDSNFPAACKSYFVLGNKCEDGPKYKKNINNSETCFYEINKKEYNDSGMCKKSEDGGRFCPLGKGDINIDNVIFFSHIVFKIYGF